MTKKHITTITFNNTDKLILHLNNLIKENKYAFRGFSKEEQLYPNIIRYEYENFELEFLKEFEKYGSNYYSATTPIDFLSYAQHFGIPTRLLDFTNNPFIALAFALYKKKGRGLEGDDKDYYYIIYFDKSENIHYDSLPLFEFYNNYSLRTDSYATRAIQSINMLDAVFNKGWLKDGTVKLAEFIKNYKGKKTMEEIEKLNKKILSKQIFLIEPNLSNQRIIMQQGLFLIPYTLNKQEHKAIITSNTSLIKIDKSIRNDLLDYLNVLGFNFFRLMPDITSVCEEIKRNIKK